MAHIAIVTSQLIGRIHASFELASRLQQEGHIITYLCQPNTQEKIRKNGFTSVSIPEITFFYNNPQRATMESSWFKKLIFHLKHRNNHYAEGVKILNLEEHKKSLKKVNPDLILVDTELHEIIFTAWESKIPIKLFTTWFSDTISLGNPSIRTTIIPGVGFSGSRIGIFLSWLIMRLKINGRVLINRLKFEHYRRLVIVTYAKKIGFNMEGLLINTLPPLFSFKELPIITFIMPELEFPYKKPKNIIYVGPMVYEKRVDKSNILADENELDVILQNISEERKKLIYCSVGSLAKNGVPFLKKVIEVFVDKEDWFLILSLGPNLSASDFVAVPHNVCLFNWVPQLHVIKKSDCVLTHAGNNTVNECLHFAVPMVLYSGKKIDQNGTAARFAYHGLGVLGSQDKDSPKQIKANIEQALMNKTFRVRLNKFHSLYLDYKERPLTPLLFDF